MYSRTPGSKRANPKNQYPSQTQSSSGQYSTNDDYYASSGNGGGAGGGGGYYSQQSRTSGAKKYHQASSDQYFCHKCESSLIEEELGFYPCSCSYNICQLCYKVALESRDSLCPFCEKKYQYPHRAYNNNQSYLQRQQASNGHYNHKYTMGSSGTYSSSAGMGAPLSTSRSAQAPKINNSAQSVRQVKHISQNYDTISSSNVSSYSQKQNSQSGYSQSNTSNHNYHSGNINAYYNTGGQNYQSNPTVCNQTAAIHSTSGSSLPQQQVSSFTQNVSQKGFSTSQKQQINESLQLENTPKKKRNGGDQQSQHNSSQKAYNIQKGQIERKTQNAKDKLGSSSSKLMPDKSQSNCALNLKEKKDTSAELGASPILIKAQSELAKGNKLKTQQTSSSTNNPTNQGQIEQRDQVSSSTEQKSSSDSQTRSQTEDIKIPQNQQQQQLVKQSQSQPNLMMNQQPVMMMPPSMPSPPLNPARLSSVRILQKHILYAIGLSPSIAKEEILRKYQFFGQYGQITNILINKDKVHKDDNQLQSYSAFISYLTPQQASIGILAVDQFSYEGRMIKASFGRTKYCKFFLKQTACLNKECPYQHSECDKSEILTQDDMQKSQIFQQYYALAFQLSLICFVTEDDFKNHIRMIRKQMFGPNSEYIQTVLPTPESIYDKKALFKQFEQYKKQNQQMFKQAFAQYHQHAQMMQHQQQQQQFLIQQHQAQQQFAANQHLQQKQILMNAAVQIKPDQASQILIAPNQGYQMKAAQSRNNGNQLLNVSSKAFQVKNRTQAQLQSNFLQQEKMMQEKLEACVRNQESSENQEGSKKQKRNNSTDKLILKDSIQSEELRIQELQGLKQQIKDTFSQFDDPSSSSNSGEQSSPLNREESKQLSDRSSEDSPAQHFIQDGEKSSSKQIRERKRSRRSSVGQGYKKKGSMKEQLYESLKFLVDDNDVIPNKRESLIQKQDTKLPSEFLNVQTPGQSNFGGQNEEDHMWNCTLFSQNEYSNQKHMIGFDEKSSYSYQGQTNSQFQSNDKKNATGSQLAGSYYNQHQQVIIRPFIETGNPNTRSVHNNATAPNYFSSLGTQAHQQNNPTYYQMGRKTTLVNEQTSTSIVGDNKSPQMMRSPSQPNYEKLQIGSINTRNGLNTPYHPSQTSLTYKNSTMPFQDQPKQSFSVADTNSNKPSYKLNQQNLDLLDKQFYDSSTNKDLYYAKIFTQAGTASQHNQISSQSLFCFQIEDDDSDMRKQPSMFSERGGQIQVPRTPIKINREINLEDSEYDNTSQSQGLTKRSEAKNYYQELLSVRDDSVFSANYHQKRRNSLEQQREMNPQFLQFNNTFFTQIADNQTDNGRVSHQILDTIDSELGHPFHNLKLPAISHSAQKKSKSRSKNRKAVNDMISSELSKE